MSDAKDCVVYVSSFNRKPNPRYIWRRGPLALAFCYVFKSGFERYELRLILRRRRRKTWMHIREFVLPLSEWEAA